MISKIQTGDTFRTWIRSTNEAIDDLNKGSSSAGTANGLVRYDSSGQLSFTDIVTTNLTVGGTHVNAISNDFNTFDANTLLTGTAVQDYFLNHNSVLWDEHVNQNTNITLSTTQIELDVETINIATITKDLFTVTANARFDQNLEIAGDLRIIGDQVSIATTELTVEDKVVTLNKGSSLSANGAGIEIEDGSGTIVGSFTYNDQGGTYGFDLSTTAGGGDTVKLIPRGNITIDLDQDLSTISSVEFASANVTGTLQIPYELSPGSTGLLGEIRYNAVDHRFEGHDGIIWGSLGGVATPDGLTYLSANDMPHQLEFYTNSNNLMTITETTIDVFNHAFANVSSNLISSSLSTDFITANAVKTYVDSEIQTQYEYTSNTANDLWANVQTIEITSLATRANVANLQVNTSLLQANTSNLWANLVNAENTIWDLVNNPRDLVNLSIGTATTTAYGTLPTVFNSGTFDEPVFDFTFPAGQTGVGIQSVEKTANNEITVAFTDSTSNTFVFNVDSLQTLTSAQKSTVVGDDYELRVMVDGSGNPTGELTVWNPMGTPAWTDVAGGGASLPSANTTLFYGFRTADNNLILDIAEGADTVELSDYKAHMFGVGVDLEIQHNHLILVTN